MTRSLFVLLFATVCFLTSGRAAADEPRHADVVVYGSTPGGVCAAIAASREGASVILLEPTDHVGGMNTGGLSLSDSFGSIRATMGGLWREWHERILKDYADRGIKLKYSLDSEGDHWTWEPHVAMRVTQQMLEEANIPVLTERYLKSVEKEGQTIKALVTKNGTFKGKVFIDATYEGDLMAAAGVGWTIGREARADFDEPHAGVQYEKQVMKINGFDDLGSPLPLVTGTQRLPEGTGDDALQVFSFRLVCTRDPKNIVPMPEPANYDLARWELLRRHIKSGGKKYGFDLYRLPSNKFDGNDCINYHFSLGFVGGGQDWCEADEAGRAAIWEAHRQYTLELIHFLKTDPVVPQKVRDKYIGLGLCKDEFIEHDHFPPALYVRQGRRMQGAYLMTEKDITQHQKKEDPIAVSSFPIDAHDVTRVAKKGGGVVTEGKVLVWQDAKGKGPYGRHGYPYHVPYRAITPKAQNCDNLLVPIALSCTHVVICSIRVEPTWMVIGQSAGVAAALAAKQGVRVQDVSYAELRNRLLDQKQVLDLPMELVQPQVR